MSFSILPSFLPPSQPPFLPPFSLLVFLFCLPKAFSLDLPSIFEQIPLSPTPLDSATLISSFFKKKKWAGKRGTKMTFTSGQDATALV